MIKYKVIMGDEVTNKAELYLKSLISGKLKPGAYLQDNMADINLSELSVSEFINLLINTKKPQIFAESHVYGNGSDWNLTELSILGDTGIAVFVTVYDNGRHNKPQIHTHPFNAYLLYTPGALLRNDTLNTPADQEEVTIRGEICFEKYYSLYKRRLLPLLLYADELAGLKKKKALITIPGIGTGQFAGKFKGELGEMFEHVLKNLLKEYSNSFRNIKAVYYDPFTECENKRFEISGISLMVRPLTKGNMSKPQLCSPAAYEESGDNFADCDLFSFVAWDHVSWPGNDFYTGARVTDDGVKAAATSSMESMTGITGFYNTETNTYDPPEEYRNWEEVVYRNCIKINC